MNRLRYVLPLLITLITLGAYFGFAQEIADRRSSPKDIVNELSNVARQQVLQIFVRLSNDDRAVVLSGQNLGHSNFDPVESYLTNVERLGRHTGRLPAILGVDYGYDEFPQNFTETNHLLRQHYQSHGLVTISMHPPNPWKKSDSHDLRIRDLRELTDRDTKVYKRWHETLDHIADGLSELQQQNVVVLWRPLHEMNGGWFWWGAHTKNRWVSREEFVAVWQDMHKYFNDVHGLHNLLWVYSAAVQNGPGEKPADYYYPGDAYVDVVGLDWYDDALQNLDAQQSYSQLVALGKPLGLTEFGPLRRRDGSFDNRLLTSVLAEKYPKIGFFLYWHSWPGADVAIVDHQGSRALMNDPQVTTLEHEGP